MNDVELTYKQRKLLIRITVLLVVAVLALFFMVVLSSYQSRVDITNTLRTGCERSKADRIDNASAWTAHRVYITKVTGADSVQEDVKRAARIANRTYRRVSRHLKARSKVECRRAFPDPPFFKLSVVG